jgi:hypothetical protein
VFILLLIKFVAFKLGSVSGRILGKENISMIEERKSLLNFLSPPHSPPTSSWIKGAMPGGRAAKIHLAEEDKAGSKERENKLATPFHQLSDGGSRTQRVVLDQGYLCPLRDGGFQFRHGHPVLDVWLPSDFPIILF